MPAAWRPYFGLFICLFVWLVADGAALAPALRHAAITGLHSFTAHLAQPYSLRRLVTESTERMSQIELSLSRNVDDCKPPVATWTSIDSSPQPLLANADTRHAPTPSDALG
jgi:hypothetical protein